MSAIKRHRKKDGRRNNGGPRPNAGRPPTDTECFCVRLRRKTRVLVDRFAKSKGLSREEGRVFWDLLLNMLLENVTVPEPEYLQFIPEARLRMLSAHTAE